jgi:hypothetical protein
MREVRRRPVNSRGTFGKAVRRRKVDQASLPSRAHGIAEDRVVPLQELARGGKCRRPVRIVLSCSTWNTRRRICIPVVPRHRTLRSDVGAGWVPHRWCSPVGASGLQHLACSCSMRIYPAYEPSRTHRSVCPPSPRPATPAPRSPRGAPRRAAEGGKSQSPPGCGTRNPRGSTSREAARDQHALQGSGPLGRSVADRTSCEHKLTPAGPAR